MNSVSFFSLSRSCHRQQQGNLEEGKGENPRNVNASFSSSHFLQSIELLLQPQPFQIYVAERFYDFQPKGGLLENYKSLKPTMAAGHQDGYG